MDVICCCNAVTGRWVGVSNKISSRIIKLLLLPLFLCIIRLSVVRPDTFWVFLWSQNYANCVTQVKMEYILHNKNQTNQSNLY